MTILPGGVRVFEYDPFGCRYERSASEKRFRKNRDDQNRITSSHTFALCRPIHQCVFTHEPGRSRRCPLLTGLLSLVSFNHPIRPCRTFGGIEEKHSTSWFHLLVKRDLFHLVSVACNLTCVRTRSIFSFSAAQLRSSHTYITTTRVLSFPFAARSRSLSFFF